MRYVTNCFKSVLTRPCSFHWKSNCGVLGPVDAAIMCIHLFNTKKFVLLFIFTLVVTLLMYVLQKSEQKDICIDTCLGVGRGGKIEVVATLL